MIQITHPYALPNDGDVPCLVYVSRPVSSDPSQA
jgi:hypothetical protein